MGEEIYDILAASADSLYFCCGLVWYAGGLITDWEIREGFMPDLHKWNVLIEYVILYPDDFQFYGRWASGLYCHTVQFHMGWKHLTVGESSIGGVVCSMVFLLV